MILIRAYSTPPIKLLSNNKTRHPTRYLDLEPGRSHRLLASKLPTYTHDQAFDRSNRYACRYDRLTAASLLPRKSSICHSLHLLQPITSHPHRRPPPLVTAEPQALPSERHLTAIGTLAVTQNAKICLSRWYKYLRLESSHSFLFSFFFL